MSKESEHDFFRQAEQQFDTPEMKVLEALSDEDIQDLLAKTRMLDKTAIVEDFQKLRYILAVRYGFDSEQALRFLADYWERRSQDG